MNVDVVPVQRVNCDRTGVKILFESVGTANPLDSPAELYVTVRTVAATGPWAIPKSVSSWLRRWHRIVSWADLHRSLTRTLAAVLTPESSTATIFVVGFALNHEILFTNFYNVWALCSVHSDCAVLTDGIFLTICSDRQNKVSNLK